MNKLLSVLAVLVFIFSLYGTGMCLSTQEDVTMPASPSPALLDLTGTSDIALAPGRLPVFTQSRSDNPACDALLLKDYSQGGLSFSPLGSSRDFQTVEGLTKIGFQLPAQFRDVSKLLVTWTIRIVAELPEAEGYKIDGSIHPKCEPFHGFSTQLFKGGEIVSKLYVNGNQYGDEASMEMPDGITVTRNQPPPPPPPSRDPTVTGSVLLSKESFPNKVFPESMNIEVRWFNDTTMRIKSLANHRSLTITVTPISQE
jgi:hypothetical protein